MFGNEIMTVKNIVKRVENTEPNHKKDKLESLKDALIEIAPDLKSNGINNKSLGKKLAQFKGRIENGFKIEKMSPYQGVDTWRVVKIN